MFYLKTKLTNSVEIKVDIYDDEIYCTCPGCGAEVQVDTESLSEILKDGDFSSSSVYCAPCGTKFIYENKEA